jgi:CRISPR-associated protein Csx10
MRYIPGATLRGAVGTRLARAGDHTRDHRGEANCPFCQVFLADPPPRFSPCYPVGHRRSESRPFPATARTCKYTPGIPVQKGDEAHGIWDTLIAQWLVEVNFEKSRRLLPGYPFRCHICDADMEPLRGGVYELDRSRLFQPRVMVQRFSRVALDRRRRVAADQLLYTLEVVSEVMHTGRGAEAPTRFKGSVWVADTAEVAMERALREVICLGGDTARGLGAVEIEVEQARTPSPETIAPDYGQSFAAAGQAAAIQAEDYQAVAQKNVPDLVARLAHFNAKLRQMAQAQGVEVPAGLYFTVDLISDLVWTEDGLPSPLLPETLAGAERVRAWASARPHGGWHTAAGLMRRTYLAMDAGSVFLYHVPPETSAGGLTQTLNALACMERHGLGVERERGYGWIEICSPFHLEVEQK